MILICPTFFDGRLDGIGRVSGAFYEEMERLSGARPFVLSANDSVGACRSEEGICYAGRYSKMIIDAMFRRRVWPLTRSEKGVIVCTHLGLSPVARILAVRLGVPYAVFVHGVESWRRIPARSRWGMGGAAVVFTNSEYTRRTFFAHNAWAARFKTQVVPLGAVEGFKSTVETQNEARRETVCRILTVGRMSNAGYYQKYRAADEVYKGFKSLVAAIGLVAERYPNIQLCIVGDGDARPELQSWVESRPESRFVQFAGRIHDEELRRYYARSHIFALPSEGEGFGLVFTEAMAFGLPCVCVAAGAAPEIVEDGVTGLVAKPRDVHDLAAKLKMLVGQPELRSKLGAAAHAHFESFYTSAAFQARVRAALEEVTLG